MRISQTRLRLLSHLKGMMSRLRLHSPSKEILPKQRFHLAIGVADIQTSVEDYSRRLASPPVLVIDGEYALWRTPILNFSIRKTAPDTAGMVRHLGWEDASAMEFSSETDVNGILWERFAAEHQADEIHTLWPRTRYQVPKDSGQRRA